MDLPSNAIFYVKLFRFSSHLKIFSQIYCLKCTKHNKNVINIVIISLSITIVYTKMTVTVPLVIKKKLNVDEEIQGRNIFTYIFTYFYCSEIPPMK